MLCFVHTTSQARIWLFGQQNNQNPIPSILITQYDKMPPRLRKRAKHDEDTVPVNTTAMKDRKFWAHYHTVTSSNGA